MILQPLCGFRRAEQITLIGVNRLDVCRMILNIDAARRNHRRGRISLGGGNRAGIAVREIVNAIISDCRVSFRFALRQPASYQRRQRLVNALLVLNQAPGQQF